MTAFQSRESADFANYICIDDRPIAFDTEAAEMIADTMFVSEEMRRAAKFCASAHPHALDYLRQAPVLAIAVHAGGGRLNGGRGNRSYAEHKMRQVCQRGGRLKDILRAYGMPLQFRQLKAKALSLNHEKLLPKLAGDIDPSTLAQIIPTSIDDQRRWLSSLSAALVQSSKKTTGRLLPLRWLAIRLSADHRSRGEIKNLVDFLCRGDRWNDSWSLARAEQEMRDWHDRLSAGDCQRHYGVMANMIVDRGKHPDHLVIDGIEFVALRTPTAIYTEGMHMRHCVASYVQSVINGSCSIISVQRDEKRLATLELRKGRISQLKGRFNQAVSEDISSAARCYIEQIKRKAGQ